MILLEISSLHNKSTIIGLQLSLNKYFDSSENGDAIQKLKKRVNNAVRGSKRVTYVAKAFKVSQEGMGAGIVTRERLNSLLQCN